MNNVYKFTIITLTIPYNCQNNMAKKTLQSPVVHPSMYLLQINDQNIVYFLLQVIRSQYTIGRNLAPAQVTRLWKLEVILSLFPECQTWNRNSCEMSFFLRI